MTLSIMDSDAVKRVIIVHVHMFKNAGSTFDWSLKKNFGRDFIDHREDDKMRQGAKYFGPYLEENAHVKAVSSHHIRLPLPDVKGCRCLPVFILRHPVDRIGSVYAFHRKQKSDTPGAVKAKEMSFKEYVCWFMDKYSPATIRDFQTRYCSGNIGVIKNLTEKEYNDARQSLQNTPLVGIVEQYAESMVLFEHHLKEFFPGINLGFKKQNVGKRQADSMETRIRNIEAELGEEAMNLVKENNHYDFMLYEEAKKLLASRLSGVAGVEDRLKEFGE